MANSKNIDRGYVKQLLEKGRSPPQIAEELGVALQTIHYHKKKIEEAEGDSIRSLMAKKYEDFRLIFDKIRFHEFDPESMENIGSLAGYIYEVIIDDEDREFLDREYPE